MSARIRLACLCVCLLLALPLALSACGGDGKQTITGQVISVVPSASMFSIQTADGKRYDFKIKAGSNIDLVHVKEHMHTRTQIKVEFTGTTSPYEASYAD